MTAPKYPAIYIIGFGASGGPHSAAVKSKKKGKGSGKGSKFGDASHLLGFSVASERVNAGDIDVPQWLFRLKNQEAALT